ARGTPLRTILVEPSACSVLRVGERFDTVFALDAVLAAARQLLTGDVDQSIGLLLMWRDGTAVRCHLAVGLHRDQRLANQVRRAGDEVHADGRFGVLHALATNTLERIVATSVAEARARTFGRPPLEDVPEAQYSESVVRTTFRFITQGVLRGRCGHSHKTMEGAARCLIQDELGCQAQGGDGHPDRRIFVGGGGTRRELNASELATVEALRPALAKERAEPSKPGRSASELFGRPTSPSLLP